MALSGSCSKCDTFIITDAFLNPNLIPSLFSLSDVHYQIPDGPCRDILPKQNLTCPSGDDATVSFIERLLDIEKPDIVIHTGDVVDYATYPSSDGMDVIYGLSQKAGVPWAATLGNHEDDSDLSRPDVMDYIVNMEGTLSQVNALGEGETEAYGNFYLEIFKSSSSEKPSFRTYHLDANTNKASINSDQVNWFNEQSAALNAKQTAPALAFFHVPLPEYLRAVLEGAPMSGALREHPCVEPVNTGLFDALHEEGSVKATFVGHDHTNDFCALYNGIHLCYEGSPGYRGYGHCNVKHDKCVQRRARVTEIRDFGETIVTWKRLDDRSVVPAGTSIIDQETLWTADGSHMASMLAGRTRSTVSQADVDALPKLEQ